MKKKILLFIMMTLLLFPFTAFAKEETSLKDGHKSMNLEETLKAEGIEFKASDYKETDKQVTVYLFRGTGCTYCKSFLEFLNEITEEYGKYFKLESYEVWVDANNSSLMNDVSTFLEQPAGGVPYIIIGDQVFPGFAEDYEESIKTAIKELYDSEERYDVFKAMEEAARIEARKEKLPVVYAIANAIFTLIISIVVMLLSNKKNKKLEAKVNVLEKKLKEVYKHEKEKHEVKEETKDHKEKHHREENSHKETKNKK